MHDEDTESSSAKQIALYSKFADDVNAIRARYSLRESDDERAAVVYGSLLVRSLFFINSGALLILPAYLSQSEGTAEYNVDAFVWPAILFVAGILFSGISGFSAYYNFINRALAWQELSGIEIHQSQNFFESVSGTKMFLEESSDVTYELDLKKLNPHIRTSFYVGLISGIASMASFVAGCIFTGLGFLGGTV